MVHILLETVTVQKLILQKSVMKDGKIWNRKARSFCQPLANAQTKVSNTLAQSDLIGRRLSITMETHTSWVSAIILWVLTMVAINTVVLFALSMIFSNYRFCLHKQNRLNKKRLPRKYPTFFGSRFFCLFRKEHLSLRCDNPLK